MPLPMDVVSTGNMLVVISDTVVDSDGTNVVPLMAMVVPETVVDSFDPNEIV